MSRRRLHVARALAIVAGAILTLIGLRFIFWPEVASRFFGVGARPEHYEFHRIIALRDVWLGLLAVALAAYREYRALALWLGLGSLVCLGDAAIVLMSTGKTPAMAFHVFSGLVCASLAFALWKEKDL